MKKSSNHSNRKLIDVDIEELTEIISEKVVSKLEEKFKAETSFLDWNRYDIEDSNTVKEGSAFLDTEIDEGHRYFKWRNRNGLWALEIEDESLDAFFLDLFKNNDKLYKKFLRALEADVVVSVMGKSVMDTLLKLKSTPKESFNTIKTFTFNSSDEFNSELLNLIDDFEGTQISKKDIKFELENYLDTYLEVPKIMLPMVAYTLSKLKIFSENNLKNVLNNNQIVSLRWLSATYPDIEKQQNEDFEKLIKSQYDIQNFLSVLDSNKVQYQNSSLNFYIFNDLTKLFDVYLLTHSIYKNDPFFKMQKHYAKENYMKLSGNYRYRRKEAFCDTKVSINRIKGILTRKIFAKKYFRSNVVSSESFIELFNDFYNIAEKELEESVLQLFDKEDKYAELFHEVKESYIIYDSLCKISPYDEYIHKLKDKIKSSDVLSKDATTKDAIWYELYHYSYKSNYDLYKKTRSN